MFGNIFLILRYNSSLIVVNKPISVSHMVMYEHVYAYSDILDSLKAILKFRH